MVQYIVQMYIVYPACHILPSNNITLYIVIMHDGLIKGVVLTPSRPSQTQDDPV